MRRLPIYFLVDVSESMVGAQIEEVQQGMRTIIQELRTDPYSLETVFVSIIAFAGKAEVISPLTELYKFYPPVFPIGGGTSLAAGLECLMDDMDRSVRKTTMEEKGDWKPIIFLFTDGNPTDDCSKAFRRWNDHYRRHCSLVAISIGDNVNPLILSQITDDILLLKDTARESLRRFFKWVTASIKTSSQSIGEQYTDGVKLAPTSGINLEKVDPKKGSTCLPHDLDDNFAVIHARCQTTGKDYLIKYSSHSQAYPGQEIPYYSTDYRLVGAYPIDKDAYGRLSAGQGAKINTMKLTGVPTCPCCGNQHGAVVCECGNVFCADGNGELRCPWCGMTGYLGQGSAEGMNIGRALG